MYRLLSALLASVFLLTLSFAGRPAGVQAAGPTLPRLLAGPVINETILPSSSVWYAFRYPGDGSDFGVTLDYGPVPRGDTQRTMLVGFNAYQPDGTYVGRSTDTGRGPGQRYWLMSSDQAGTWWLEVVNHSPVPVVYSLTPSASRQPLPSPGLAPAAVVPEIPPDAADRVAIAEAFGYPSLTSSRPGGTTARSAQIIIGRMVGNVPAGESRWYRFWYTGLRGRAVVGVDFGHTDITAANAPSVAIHGPSGEVVGVATADHLPGNQVAWSIDSDRYGTYYVEIHNPSAAGANYNLVLISDRY